MKIALIVPGGVDPSGRVRVIPVLLSLIQRLARRHQVLVAPLSQEPEPVSYQLWGARIVSLGRVPGRLPAVAFLQRWRRLLAAFNAWGDKPDIIHALWLGGTSTLALLTGRWLKVPVVVSVGGGELVRLPQIGYGGLSGPLGRLHARLALNGAQAVTAGSRYTLARVAKRRPEAHWLPLGAEAQPLRGPVARPPGPPWRLLHVASINRVKDQATLLRALRLVVDRYCPNPACYGNLQLDWVGEDTLNGAMQQLTKDLGLGGFVRFHGFKPVDEIYPLYRQAHLYLQSSLHESQGVAVCEAAAAGVPTVGTAVGLVAELAPTAAWAVPVGDCQGLAEGILTLLGDQTRLEQLGKAAQAWAQKYDAQWTATAFEAIYASLFHTP